MLDLRREASHLYKVKHPPKCHFEFFYRFAGIGGIRLAFERIGDVCVFSPEWDNNACKTYKANFNEEPHGDITKIEAKDIPDFDILSAGFPCQPFSIAGKKASFNHETQGTLFFDVERILKKTKSVLACIKTGTHIMVNKEHLVKTSDRKTLICEFLIF